MRRPTAPATAAVALALALALALAGCSSPESDVGRYREEAATTLEAAHSQVATARMTVRARLAGRIPSAAADDTVTTAETSLDALSSSFAALQPPRGADAIRTRATSAMSDAVDALGAARIATRRRDRAALTDALHRLDDALRQVDGLREQWS